MSPIPTRLSPASPRVPRFRRLAVAMIVASALVSTTALVAPPEAAAVNRHVSVSPGRAKDTVSAQTVTEGTARAAFVVPRFSKGSVTFAVNLRRQNSDTMYKARVVVDSKGAMRVGLVRVVRGRESLLSTGKIGARVRAGQTIWLEGSVSGSRVVVLTVRAWNHGTHGPAGQKSGKDSSSKRIAKAGQVGATIRVSRSGENKVKVRYHSLRGVEKAVVPSTTIRSGTRNGSSQTSRTVSYGFSSNVPDATFQCSLDSRAFSACRSPARYTSLTAGKHSFRVRAKSYRGKVDQTPASRTVTVGGPALAPALTRKPSASTTGVPAGTKLRVHNGDIVVTRAGTRLDRMDIRGFVVVRAANVKITRSIVRGGVATNNQGLITNYGSPNLLIEDTDLRAAHPSVWLDGIKGWNFTARRVHVVGNVDSIKVHGDNATIENSLLEDTVYYANDPNQRGGPTHNDNIQVLKGKNIRIVGNTIRGATNFAILGTANIGHTPNLYVRGNWVDGGHCTIKMQSLRSYKLSATVVDNKFGPHRKVSYCPFQAEPQVKLTARNNVMEEGGRPVPILRKKY